LIKILTNAHNRVNIYVTIIVLFLCDHHFFVTWTFFVIKLGRYVSLCLALLISTETQKHFIVKYILEYVRYMAVVIALFSNVLFALKEQTKPN
jgi:hypothetical protein